MPLVIGVALLVRKFLLAWCSVRNEYQTLTILLLFSFSLAEISECHVTVRLTTRSVSYVSPGVFWPLMHVALAVCLQSDLSRRLFFMPRKTMWLLLGTSSCCLYWHFVLCFLVLSSFTPLKLKVPYYMMLMFRYYLSIWSWPYITFLHIRSFFC